MTRMDPVHWNGKNSFSSSPESIEAWYRNIFPMILEYKRKLKVDDLSEEESVKKAEILFSKIDINNEGYVTEEEFVAVCLGDRDLVTVMKSEES